MTRHPTLKDLRLDQVTTLVESFVATNYDTADPDFDGSLPTLWAWACVAEFAADHAVKSMGVAQDHGYTLQQIGDTLGVTKQAVGQRLLRATRPPINKAAPATQTERLPGI